MFERFKDWSNKLREYYNNTPESVTHKIKIGAALFGGSIGAYAALHYYYQVLIIDELKSINQKLSILNNKLLR